MRMKSIALIGLPIAALTLFNLSTYSLQQTEQVILTQFGRTVGEPVTEPGLHFKIPFIQQVNTVDKRYLPWDGPLVEMTTKDKTYIQVETFARWRIVDANKYFLRLRDERSAQSRLEDILGSETRTAVARHELIEVVRVDKTRKPLVSTSAETAPPPGVAVEASTLLPVQTGRMEIEKAIYDAAAPKLEEFGIELLDIRFKRINYNPAVLSRIHQRMISERNQIAQRFRSEGEGEAARILGNKERDINEINSLAYQKVQEIRGEADARATEIYAKAYTQRPEAEDFYRFLKSMETYGKVVNKDATFVMSTNSDLFALLKRVEAKTKP